MIPDYDDEDCPVHPGIECELNVDDIGNPECPCTEDCCAIVEDEIDFSSKEEDTE